MENNKLDKTFGPIGSFAGIVILLFGAYACFYSWIGITTVIVGLFLAFTDTSAKLDFENKRIKYSLNIFGFLSIGHWTEIKQGMRFIVKNPTRVYTANSQSNRKTEVSQKDYRVILQNDKEQDLMAVKKFVDKENAEKYCEEIYSRLNK